MDKSIIIYDGVCHLCNGFVHFILKRDPAKRFQFGYLQSAAAQERLRAFVQPADVLDSVVLLENDRMYSRSTAALRIARHLQGGWSLFYVFILVPAFIRDAVYEFIGRRRYRWFGKGEACLLPGPEYRDRFID